MSEILERIGNEKIEWKRLGEVCEINKFKQISAEILENLNMGFGEIYLLPSSKNYNWKTTREKAKDLICKGKVITLGRARYSNIKYCDGEFISSNNIIIASRDENFLVSKFLYYFISLNHEKFYVETGSYPKFTSDIFKNFEIPIPSLETQEKIVKILDKFQKYASELQHELQHELQNRTKQYEYYRDYLLSEKYLLKKENKIEKFKLSDLVTYGKEKISFNLLNEDNYVGVDNLLKDKMGKEKSQYVPEAGVYTKYNENDILIGNIRPYLRKIWISNQNGGASGDVLVIKIKENYVEKINPKYLYYILSSEDFFEYSTRYSRGGKMPRGDKEKIMEYEIKIPTIKVQSKIVEMLDKIEKIVNNLKEGLPKEIELRQKQYEYYRDKLFNFKEI